MEQKGSNKAGWFTLISFICGVITLVTFEEMDSSVKTIENMDEIGAAILVLFSAMTIGGIFWMGMNYWRKTHQELVKLQYTSLHLKRLKIITEQLQRLFVRSVFLSLFLHSCSECSRSSIAFLK